MAVPFRRTSITKKRMRRTHLKRELPGVIACPKCGNYKGKKVIETENEE